MGITRRLLSFGRNVVHLGRLGNMGFTCRLHFNYFGVSGNFRSLLRVTEQAKRIGYKWLCRRSQRKRLTWERFADLLRDFPLPKPRITVKIWGL
jgi:hypothetical protein